MRVSYRWLTELLPKLNRDANEVAEALTAVGLAVDGIVDHGSLLRPVILAEILGVEKHPSKSGLQLVRVRTRPETAPPPMASLPPESMQKARSPVASEVTIVCGAKNVPAPGHLVVLAGLGVKLPGVDFVLEPREIGGVKSEGMLCSEAELGLAESSEGILTLPPGSARPGARFIDVFPEARDVVYELDITPNRPDALGHVGVARDLGAFFEYDLRLPESEVGTEYGEATAKVLEVENREKGRCPKYAAGLVRDVVLEASPDFVRWRLHRLGVRAISNVVDVTNWLLLEYGQPLHAFDFAAIRGRKIVVRAAEAGEKMKTLDGVERTLEADDLLIGDAVGPSALAGIMGGAVSEVGSATKDVVLECAYFAPRGIRRTARRQGMHTESSHRFERGTDHGAVETVMNRARRLLAEWCKGRVAPGILTAHGEPIALPEIEFRGERMDSLLGVDVPFREATRVLSRLGFSVEFARDTKEGQAALIRGASHRPDVSIEADLIEEVARIRGLDNIPTVLPSIPPQEPRTSLKLERTVANLAASLGLSEALTYAFVAPKDLEAVFAPPSVVTLENPLSEERSVLRTTLLPGLLEALRRARRRGQTTVTLFSVGSVFHPPGTPHRATEARPARSEDKTHLPYEEPRLAFVLSGTRPEHLSPKSEEYDLYDAKGIAFELVERITGKTTAKLESARGDEHARHLHPRGAAKLTVDGAVIGTLGPLHPDVVEALDLGDSAIVCELSIAAIENLGASVPKYRALPKLPAIERDLSLVVSDTQSGAGVTEAIASSAGELCESVRIVAEFRGGSVPSGHRSLTFRITYRDPLARSNKEGARTLTDKEVDQVQASVLAMTAEKFGATLRA